MIPSPDNLELQDWLDIVLRRWPWMLITLLLLLGLGFVWTVTRQRYYSAVTEVVSGAALPASAEERSMLPVLSMLDELERRPFRGDASANVAKP